MKSSETLLTTITFETAGQLMAVDATHLREVIEPLPVSPLPFVPAYLEGLVNVNGQILPQVNLATFLANPDFPIVTTDEAMTTLLVVEVDRMPVVLRVGQVFEPHDIEQTALSAVAESFADSWQVDKLAGSFDFNERPVLLPDLHQIVALLGQRGQQTAGAGDNQSFLGKATQTELHEERQLDYLLIETAGRLYACALEDIQEVMDVQNYSVLHRAEPWITGITLVHDVPVLLLQMQGLIDHALTLEQQADNDQLLHVLMILGEGYYCGLVVDAVKGLRQVNEDQCLFDPKSQRTTLMLDDVGMIEVLPVHELMTSDILGAMRAHQPNLKERTQVQTIPTREYLRFFIADDAFAIDIHAINRIVGQRTITPLLDEHAYVLGTIELEGHVLPVIDLNRQLGYDDRHTDLSYNEFVVVSEDDDQWALAIANTDDIISVPEPDIDSLLDDAALIQAYARYQKKLVNVLNLGRLCVENVQPHRASA